MRTIILLLAVLAIAACDKEEHSSAESESVEQHKQVGITWFDGSVEQAFAKANAAGNPLFLYWGAVWCPPCQEIKSTVFKSQDFINLSRLFIPVYLDGDTDQAQAWGEKFGVMGYPTMIVFNPTAEEVTRIPGGIDIDRYNSVLELSLNKMRPTSQLVQYALTNPDRLDKDDFYQLAYYSWDQDTGAVPEGTDKTELFRVLAARAPKGELSARFYLNYLVVAARKLEDDVETAGELDASDIHDRLTAILSSDHLTLACWDTLAYYPDELLEMPIFDDDQKQLLDSLWVNSVFTLRDDASLSKAEKMSGWLPRLYVATREDKLLDSDIQEKLRKELMSIDEDTADAYERQSVISRMSYVYRQAGMKKDAKELLQAELNRSASPYYFMSGLASMTEKDGEFTEAIDWSRQAWENSTGQATRLQWGASYVRALIRMAPDDIALITSASISLLAEFHESQALFSGRNFRTLRRLNRQLLDWQDEQQATEFTFQTRVEEMCSQQLADSQEEENCKSLFVEEAVAQAS
ncbi:MAG: thioredoxin fold domain-containing protein [Gammaproteobacteria bacterium]|jgi:thiol-disulfide isomerase/thioredoxin|nr:thioredoxin fold domain-containing protein [Gammaproteobacteria bacterium]MBT4493493.1 thioredoxin fold domain-containing protein [Gammaproteobacteria bacterium]MBT7370120.1 thioredoxin fold domain-containing protein [Gammaproteobacteria bacterium]